MENMEMFTPLYAISYAIMNSMENLHFDKEGYFHVLVFYGLFYKRNRKHFFPCSIRYRNTRGSLEKLEIVWKHSRYGARVPTSISRSPKLPCTRVSNCMETRKICSIS